MSMENKCYKCFEVLICPKCDANIPAVERRMSIQKYAERILYETKVIVRSPQSDQEVTEYLLKKFLDQEIPALTAERDRYKIALEEIVNEGHMSTGKWARKIADKALNHK